MRKILAIVVMLAAVAAGAEEIKTLVNDTGAWSAWIKPAFKGTQIADETAGLAGIELGPSMDRSLYMGLGAYALVNSVDEDQYGSLDALKFWYGGFVADYTFLAGEVIHGSAGFLIGGGQVEVDGILDGDSNDDSVFVFEPGVNVLANLTKGIEFGLGASYRIVTGSDIARFEDSDLSGPAATIFFRWNEE